MRGFCLLLALCVAGPARAAADCLGEIDARMGEVGATPLGPAGRSFVVAGEAATSQWRLTEPACVAIVARATRGVRGYELRLVGPGGMELAHALPSADVAYVRFCGRSGLELTAIARVDAGQGTILLRGYERAPPSLPSGAPGACVQAPEGLETPPLDLGSAPAAPSLDERWARAERLASELGYSPRWVRSGEQAGQAELRPRAGRCYAVYATTSEAAGAPALEVSAEGGWVRRARGSGGEVWLAFCPSSRTLLQLAAPEAARIGLFVASPPAVAPPAELGGDARVSFLALAAAWAARGLAPRPLAVVASAPGQRALLPVSLPAAGCYGLAAVGLDALVGRDVPLVLLDALGNRLGRSRPGDDPSTLYHCASEPEQVALVVRAPEAARAMVFLGRSAAGGGE